MNDDIVTRLRDIASLRGSMSGAVIPMACNEAADEIERLREQVAALNMVNWSYKEMVDEEFGDE